LWMQSERHPAPLFREAILQQHPVAPRKAPEPQPAPSAAPGEDPGAGVLPPPRPPGLGRAAELGPPPPPKPAGGKRPAKDPIGDLLGEPAPVPPAPIKGAGKGQSIEKATRPGAAGPSHDAIAALIGKTAGSH
jgi:hypothetical protein